MGQHILPGNPPVAVILKQSARARRISLRVSGLDSKVTLTIPRGVREREALEFAYSKADWLREQMAKQVAPVQVAIGADLPIEGQLLRIVQGSQKGVRQMGDALHVAGTPETVGIRVQAWLRTQARDRLAQASDRYATALGRSYTHISIRDTRSRWGSCSAQGGLMYSWRLILCPPDVLDYVAAHEVAHLQEMNHSDAFWSVVADLKPGYQAPRQWLRDNGAALHRYRFKD
ncbi:MAG: M48 family metallopeptidase [Roseovarius sp.]